MIFVGKFRRKSLLWRFERWWENNIQVSFEKQGVKVWTDSTVSVHGSNEIYMLHAAFLLGLLFDPEYGGDTFLKNSGWLHGVKLQKAAIFTTTAVWEPQIQNNYSILYRTNTVDLF
jgi:hypothetical protein